MLQSPASASFEKLRAYSFHSDPEFANGLAIILGHPDTPATDKEISREDDLVLQAKCFFFSRKENISPPIDFASYKSWLTDSSTCEPHETSGPAGSPKVLGSERTTGQEPTYPSSFAHIVELITTGQPIPGIEQIPDTVLTGHGISSEKPRRPKPWEKGELEEIHSEPTAELPSA
ncbi:hypothetical protein N7466_004188 [Penicillium verhagenii]|uniref:uncharacterized protein n=1 Tax=Penicillium verhagenii TaxID=1562060 RepID=UPI0025452E14|nr:uncharacterized protein N7466_004188 [Penicillium verhagenii]KAJ5934641.1 hypothetical protein N7466_004188 [Penicillium verhagenii]